MYSLGLVLLQLLTRMSAKDALLVVFEYQQKLTSISVFEMVDPTAGVWPPNVVTGLFSLAMR